MADLAGIGGTAAILQISNGIARGIVRLNDIKNAPREIREFKLSSSNFGGILQSFYEVSTGCTAKKWQKRILGLILQGRQVEDEMDSLLEKLEKNRGDGPLVDLREWWDNMIWSVFRKEPVEHLKLNMGTACAYIQTFVSIVTFDLLQVKVKSASGKEKERFEEQM